MNEHDSERIAGLLEEMGLAAVSSPDDADLLVYNTCSIREKADTRLAGHLGTARGSRARHGPVLVVVAGCLAQSRREEFFADFPFVDVLVGPQSLHELPDAARASVWSGRRHVGAFADDDHHWSADLPACTGKRPLGLGADHGRVQQLLHVLHRALRSAGPRLPARPGDILAEVQDLADRRRARGHAAWAERQRLRQRARLRGDVDFPELLHDGVRRRRNRTGPLHDVPPQGHVRRAHRGHRRAQPGLRARAPAGAVGQRPDAGGDEPALRPRGLSRSGRPGCAGRCPTCLSPPT